MLIKFIREGLGRVIIFVSWVTRPKAITRSLDGQKQVDQIAAGMSLYQFYACPFCVKVRRHLHRLNVPVVLRDAQNDKQFRQELAEQGGKLQVPCLRLDADGHVRWLYDSKAIIEYLEHTFGQVA